MTEAKIEKIITASLGVLWLLDGILQLQPAMFTNAFVNNVLAPNLQNQPSFISSVVSFGINMFNGHLVLFNLASAVIQIAIGMALVIPFSPRLRRLGLWLSAFWALIVWVFGEGFGNLATGSATFYVGAPGAALLYLILSVFLLYREKKSWSVGHLPAIAGGMLFASAMLNLAPMFWQPTTLSMLAGISSVSDWLGSFGAVGTAIGNLLAFLIPFMLGILLIQIPHKRTAWIAIVFLAAVWWLGQNFGGIFTFPSGTATDPNAAPLFALFLVPGILG